MKKLRRMLSVGAVMFAAQCVPSHAVTVGFGALDVDPYLESIFKFNTVDIVTSSCASGPCMGLRRNQTSIMTLAAGGVFSISSFWFQLLGNPAVLTVKSFAGLTNLETIIFTTAGNPANNGGQTFNHLFAGATSISFTNTGRSSLRVDDISGRSGSVSAVPTPAALPLFISGLAALGFAGRRRRKQALH